MTAGDRSPGHGADGTEDPVYFVTPGYWIMDERNQANQPDQDKGYSLHDT
jgi:hypothetical protein